MRFLRLLPLPLFDPDTGAGTGNAPPPAPPPAQRPSDDLVEINRAFKSRLEKYEGNAQDFASNLYSENHTLRREKADLQAKLDTFTGKTVLEGDDLAAWNQFKTLGKPDDIKAKLGTLSTLQRQAEIAKAAKVAGYDPDVVQQLAGELQFEVKSVQVQNNGKTETVQQVVVKQGDTETPIDQYAQTNWKAFLPVLKPQSGGNSGASGTSNGAAQGGTKWPVQQSNPSTGGTGGADLVGAFLSKRNGAPAQGNEPPAKPAFDPLRG